MIAAPLSILFASTLAFGSGLGLDRMAAARLAPEAPPPTAAPDDSGWGEEDKVPEDGWGEGDTVAPPTETPTAPPTTTTGPADNTNPTAPGTVLGGSGIERKPAPPPSAKKGIGLMVAAGGVGAIAWGMAGATAGLISKSCVNVSDPTGSVGNCVTKATSILGLTVLKWIANDVSYGLAPGAGIVRGQYEAQSFSYSGKPDRNGALIAGIGGGVLGIGIIGKVVLWGLIPKTFQCPIDPIDEYGPCVRRRFVGYFIGQQAMSSSIATGAALLAFGIYYNKERKARERLFFRPDQVRLVPDLSRDFTGLTLAGRF